ncbi:MAG: DUF1501 domain-containing protein, partial [Verrucomicrobiota bacterium]
MDPINFRFANARALTRRQFLQRAGLSIGGVALGNLLAKDSFAAVAPTSPMVVKSPVLPGRAKSVIYLHMSGAPPSLDLFDWKPKLVELNMQPAPDELIKGQKFAFIKGVPKMLGTPHKFAQHGKSGTWFSEIIPHMAGLADEACVIKSMWTDQFNHSPAELFLFTGTQRAGAASMGSWITYGLGSENQDLPGFVVLLSGGTDPTGGKSL